jgi:hypothetical protein
MTAAGTLEVHHNLQYTTSVLVQWRCAALALCRRA